MLATKVRRILVPGTFAVVALTAAPSFAEEAQIPETVAEHEERAREYREQATEYREEAQEHRQMAKEYAAKHPEMKGSPQRPDVAKMSKQCETIAKDYDKLAKDAETAADYHMMRAREMQGG